MYEHSESFPDRGRYRIYGVLVTPSGDEAKLELTGQWDVIMREGQFVEAPFAAEGTLIAGTGRFEGATGALSHSGKVTPAEGGVYQLVFTVAE